MNIEQFELTSVESILKGRISKNPKRFEEANGIVFTVNNMNNEIESYFSCRGVEIYKLEENVYYTETIMSIGAFSNIEHVLNYKCIA